MKSKTEQLNHLFESWKEKYQDAGFAEDGIIDESEWDKAMLKVMFLLKDTNNFSGDFRKAVRGGPWHVVGRWSFGLQNVKKNYILPFSEAKNNINQGCLSAAIVNLKKTPGRGVAVSDEIAEAVKRDKTFIFEELKIIQPDVIVCGATFGYVKELFPDLAEQKPLDGQKGKCYRYNEKVWIDYCHPSARYVHYMMYYTLMCLYRYAL